MTQARVRRLAFASSELTCAPVDQRGRHTNCLRKLSDSTRQQINDHIRSFPVIKSHYSRSKHSGCRKYLSPNLSVKQMHELYVQKFEKDHKNPLVSYIYYLAYFNKNFNICSGYLKSDTCSTCDQLEVQLGASGSDAVKDSVRLQKEDHLRKAEIFIVAFVPTPILRNKTLISPHLPLISSKTIPFPIFPLEKSSTCINYGSMFLEFITVEVMMYICIAGLRQLLVEEVMKWSLV